MAKQRLTTEEFIRRATLKHGNRYDYSQTDVDGTSQKVKIICSVHGEFHQLPLDHIKGRGCSLCNERQKSTKEEFVLKAVEKHGDKYRYDNVMYKNSTTKVSITCPSHGDFLQKPIDHTQGYGCPSCGGTKRKTTNEFIEQSKIVHDNFYIYDNVVLESMNKKVLITCPIHGDFEQRPADHVDGVGCPICGLGKMGGYCEEFFVNSPEMKELAAHLYLIVVDEKFCKIGITKKRYVKQRFPGLKFEVKTTKQMTLYNAYLQEQNILTKFKKYRFKIQELKQYQKTGWTECFPLDLLPELEQELVNINTNQRMIKWQH